MAIFKAIRATIWISLSPLLRTEAAVGWLDVFVRVIAIIGISGLGIAGWVAPPPETEPISRWWFVAAYPTVGSAVLFFVAAVRLRLRVEELEAPTPTPKNRDALIRRITELERAATVYVIQHQIAATVFQQSPDFPRDRLAANTRNKEDSYHKAARNLETERRIAGRNYDPWLWRYEILIGARIHKCIDVDGPVDEEAYYDARNAIHSDTIDILERVDNGSLYAPQDTKS